MGEYLIHKETLEALADTIRSKTGGEAPLTPGQMQDLVETLADPSSVTADAKDVRAGKTIVDAQGNVVPGTMPDRGSVTGIIGTNCTSHRIEKGYHDGTGVIYAASMDKEVTPSRKKQVIAAVLNNPSDYSYGYNNGLVTEVMHFLNRVTVHPIPEIYQDVSGVTAEAEDVLEGKVFVDAQGNEVVGTRKADASGIAEIVVYEKQTVNGFAVEDQFGSYTPGFVYPAEFVLEAEKEYRIHWDGVDYSCVSFAFPFSGETFHAVGNASSLGLPGNGEPFMILYSVGNNLTQIFSSNSDESHTVGIYTQASGTGESVDNVIWGSTSDGVAGSLAGNGIIRYVAFKNHDGTVEYGRKSVLAGDDCIDPVKAGYMDTPVRESTAQYSYIFSGGWATVPNGGKNTNALKAVTEDRTVYANFVSAVRYYTVTFYDSDGTTVLTTQSLAYGTLPSYTPAKEGYTFNGWDREMETVTENTSYTANPWLQKADFATLSWSAIAEYAESGVAADVLEIGAEKSFRLSDSARTEIVARIIGFNHDDLSDGSGKAGITLELDTPFFNQNPDQSQAFSSNSSASWNDSNPHKFWNQEGYANSPLRLFPADLVAVIKQVKKKYYDLDTKAVETADDYVWVESATELGYVAGSAYYLNDEGECYAAYTPNKSLTTAYPELIRYKNEQAVRYHTRTKGAAGSNMSDIDTSGKHMLGDQSSSMAYLFPCFCI